MAGWIVKFDGPCSKCGTLLRAGAPARWVRGANRMECIECPPIAAGASPTPIDTGPPGGSARREYERLQAKREEKLKERWGVRVGGLISRFADEPQSIRAWGLGARGEELLGAALTRVPGLVTLNDRSVAGTKGNIDHVAIAPAGIFVIDAKRYDGMDQIVDKGSLFRTDLRLTVGGRNRSDLAEHMEWQLKAVTNALLDAGVDQLPPVSAVLCFVDASFPILGRPKRFNGVRIESDKSLVKVLVEPASLANKEIDRLARLARTGARRGRGGSSGSRRRW